MDSKTERQLAMSLKWRHATEHGMDRNGSGTFQAVTGFGKTYGTIKFVIKPFLEVRQAYDVVILVVREQHQDQWNVNLDKDITNEAQRKRVKVFTVQYLMKNNLRLATDLLIVDEIHKFYGEDFIKYLDGTLVQYKFNLGLTATFRDKRMRHKKIEKDWKPFDIITQKEALEKGWISNFQEYNLGVELSDLEVKMYNQNNDIINKHLNKFLPHGMKAAMKCFIGGKDAETYKFVPAKVWCETLAAEKGYYHGMPTDSPIYKMWNPNLIFGYAKQIVTALRNVSDLMYYSEAKLAVTLQLLQKFKDKKTMIFGQSSMLADRIAEDFEKLTGERISVFHTQLKPRPMRDTQGELITYKTGKQAGEVKLFGIDSLKKLALTDFATNKTRVLSTVSALDENYDCPDIEIGVITGRTSDANKQTQRGGRIKRLIPKDPNAVMLIINLYNKMTKDYEWLRKAQDDSSHYIKWVNDIEDINFEVETEETFDLTDI